MIHEAEVHRDVAPAWRQRTPAAAVRGFPDRVEDHVIGGGPRGEVLVESIDHLSCTQRYHDLHALGVAHCRHLCLEVASEELHRSAAYGASRAVDEDTLLPEFRRSQAGQGEKRAVWYCR